MILFFYGPNNFAARRKLQETVTRFKSTTGSDFSLEQFDGSNQNLSINEVIGAITTVPFLAANRLIVLEDVLANKKLSEPLLPALNDAPKETVVLIYESKVDERTKLFKELKNLAKSVKFELLDEQQLSLWVRKSVQDMGGEIDKSNARILIDRVGNNQWRLWNEIHKLIAYNPKVSEANIELLVEPTFENSIFDMVETIARGQATEAIKLYLGLRNQKAQPLYILSMIAWQIRNLLVVKVAGLSSENNISDAKISPFVVNKIRPLVTGIELDNIVRSYSSIQETDLKLKTTQTNPDVLMQQLILRVTRLVQPTAK